MTTNLPIACSLSAAEMPARLAEMAAIGTASLLGATGSGRWARLRFSAEAEVRDRLSRIVVAEADCCAFLTMRLVEAPGSVTLMIDGPDGSEPIIHALVQAFWGAEAEAEGAIR